MTEQETQNKGELEDAFSGAAVDPAFAWIGGGDTSLPPQAKAGTDLEPAGKESGTDLSSATDEDAGTAVEPPEGASKQERLAHYEEIVERERNRYRDAVAAADQQFCESANEPLWRINQERLYLERRGQNGKCFTSFKAYLQECWGISRAHGYRILNEYPVRRDLGAKAPERLSTRQVAKLIAVQRSAGAEMLIKVWDTSEDKSPDALQRTIEELGLSTRQTESLDELSEADRERLSHFDRWSKTAGKLDAEQVRKVLAGDPKRARELYDQVKPFVDALAEVAALPADE